MSLMNNSRRIIQASELQRRVNGERQRIMNKEKRQLFRVPGETSTASDTQSSEGEALIDPLHCRMKKKQVVDQIIPSIKLPFLSYSSTSRYCTHNPCVTVHVYTLCVSIHVCALITTE